MLLKDFKLAVLKKIDPAVDKVTSSRTTKEYLNAFVGATNRGLQDLATTGKYIIKKYKITQQYIKNLLPMQSSLDFTSHYSDDILYSAAAASYYFEVDKTATIIFEIDNVEVLRIDHVSPGEREFAIYKGFIPNPELKPVTMMFTGQYEYNIRNVALYNQPFETEGDIWDFVSRKRYDLRELLTDFYKLSESDVVFQSGISKTSYIKTDNYEWEGDSVLVLDGQERGAWTVHYFSYPAYIPEGVADDYIIELDSEVMQLLVIFVASELVYDDDRSTSGAWRNHYEAGKQLLKPTIDYSKSEFVDVQGW